MMQAESHIPRAQIARSFGQAAARYDEYAALQRDVADRLLTQVATTAPAFLLDLGCGTGYCAAQLGARFSSAHIVAVDLAVPMLRASAVRVDQHVALLAADMHALPLRDGHADCAVSSLALQWCADPQRVFGELWRVLRPGGQALLSTFGPATLCELRSAWSSVDAHVHVNGFPVAEQLERAAAACGFGVHLQRDVIYRHYGSLRALARELKGIGAHNMNAQQRHGLTPRAAFARAEEEFSRGLTPQGVPVTWELFYLDLRKPR